MRRALLVALALGPLAAAADPPEAGEGEGASTEEVVVNADRVAEAARPDTSLRLTGRQLRERGITDLGQALDLVFDTTVRASGRQLTQVDMRGGRKGGVLLLLDGVPVSDPFFGSFDVAAIPATDIAEIRVSLTPASPLDGPGGSAGVIEVLTRSASGPPFARAQAQGSTAPSGLASATGRLGLADGVGLRASASAGVDGREVPVTLRDGSGRTVATEGRQGSAGIRVEARGGGRKLSLDLAASDRAYLIPPGETPGAGISRVPDEKVLRGVLGGDLRLDGTLASFRAYSVYEDHRGVNYEDGSLDRVATREHIRSYRAGGVAQIDVPLGADARLTAATHVLVEGGEDDVRVNGGGPDTSGSSPVLEPALGALWLTTSWLTLDGAAGVAVPLGDGRASPWPEAKVTATVTPLDALQMRLVGARKGRLPSLRDRFSPTQGNPAIGPEIGTSAEATVVFRPLPGTSLELAGYWRRTDGLIRNPPVGSGQGAGVENAGDVTVRGIEAKAEASPLPWLGFGAAWADADAQSDALGDDPLDFFPAHHGEVFATVRPTTGAGVWGRLRYVGSRLDNGVTLDPYTTLDAAAWARLGAVRLALRGENLADRRYDVRAGVPAYGRTLYATVEGSLE
jgi:hypothetical protein